MLRPLFEAERAALETAVRQSVQGIDRRGTTVVLYGSVARAEEDPFSDVDLLVIVPSKGEALRVGDHLAQKGVDFASLFGNRLSPLILEASEFVRRCRDPLLAGIVKTGRVIVGQAPNEILARGGAR